MSTFLWRLLLAPWTSWRAWRLVRVGRGSLTFDTAWRRARMERHPDEMPYRCHGHIAPDHTWEDTPRLT